MTQDFNSQTQMVMPDRCKVTVSDKSGQKMVSISYEKTIPDDVPDNTAFIRQMIAGCNKIVKDELAQSTPAPQTYGQNHPPQQPHPRQQPQNGYGQNGYGQNGYGGQPPQGQPQGQPQGKDHGLGVCQKHNRFFSPSKKPNGKPFCFDCFMDWKKANGTYKPPQPPQQQQQPPQPPQQPPYGNFEQYSDIPF